MRSRAKGYALRIRVAMVTVGLIACLLTHGLLGESRKQEKVPDAPGGASNRRLLRHLEQQQDDVTPLLPTSRDDGARHDNSSAPQCTPPAYHEFPPDAFTNSQRRRGAVLLHILVAVYMFVALAVVCDDYFVSSLGKICEKLHLSTDVAGATFMAAGSSAPELFTSLLGVFVAKGDVGVGTIVGSAVFNILFVIGLCALLAGQVVVLAWYPLLRDLLFYCLSVIILIASIANSAIGWHEATLLLLCYCVYIVIMKYNSSIQAWCVSRITFFTAAAESTANILPPPEERKYYGNYDQFNNVESGNAPIPLANIAPLPVDELTPFSRLTFGEAGLRVMMSRSFRGRCRFRAAARLLISQRQKLLRHPGYLQQVQTRLAAQSSVIAESPDKDRPEWMRPPAREAGVTRLAQWLLLTPIQAALYYTTPDCRKSRWDRWFMVTFAISIVWIAVFSYVMVSLIGYTFGIPDSVLGITFLAAGTSVPDAMASVMVARQGDGDMAVSNTVGSNVFDICIGLALPWFIKVAIVSPGSYVHINSNGMVFSVILLFLTVILTIGAVHAAGWRLTVRLGGGLILAYCVVTVVSILIELNVFGFVNPPMCREHDE